MWQRDCHEEFKLNTTAPPQMPEPNFVLAFWLESVPFPQNVVISSLFWGWFELDRRVVRTGPKSCPNWTALVRTGPRNWQNRGGPNWTAIFMFSKMAYLSRARAKEPVRTTKSGPNWTASEELGIPASLMRVEET